MKLTKSQKKYLRKNLRTKSIEDISKELKFPAKDIESYIKETYGRERYNKLFRKKEEEVKPERENIINWWILSILIILILIIYANSLPADFVSDDITNIKNAPHLTSLSYLVGGFGINLRNAVIFLINKNLGLSPIYYRTPNILFHIGSAYLIYLLVRKVISDKVALISSIIFAVHPILSESITWISGGVYAYSTFFILASLYLYSISKGNKRMYCCSIAAYVLSFLTLVQSAALAPIYVLYELCFGNLRKNYKRTLPYLIIMIVSIPWYLILAKERSFALQTQYYETNPLVNPVIQIPIAVTQYLKLIFWPKDLALYHTELSFSQASYLVHLAIFLIFVGGILWLFKMNKKLFFWPVLFIIALSPTLTPLGISWIVAERYAYLASVGIIVLFVYGLDVFIKRLNIKDPTKTLSIITILILIPLSIRTIIRNNDWKNQDTLWLATAKTSPNSPQNHNNLGDYYGRHGNINMAIIEFKKAIELKPNYADAYHNLANAYMDKKDMENAIKNYEKAIEINPNLWQSYQNLGAIYFNLGDIEKAKEFLEKALKINPENENLRKTLEIIPNQVPNQGESLYRDSP